MTQGLAAANVAAAEQHIQRVKGPTILMGDGLYFDFEAPDATGMTIWDYAWGLATAIRFRGQTRDWQYNRCAYNVAQHCVLMAREMHFQGCTPEQVYEGLMHESDEVAWGDIPGPAKMLLPPDVKALIKRSADAIDLRFGVTHNHKDLVKQYDIRMLATEKRELMPNAAKDEWSFTEGYAPFSFIIEPWSIERSAEEFVNTWSRMRHAQADEILEKVA